MAPRVTVITATFNCAPVLRLSLASLVAQSHRDFDAWIVGDACTDGSEDAVASFGDPRLHWINLATNSGSQAAPNNAGLSRATGEWIAYLGHDDLWFPWHLADLVAAAEAARADFAHGLLVICDPDGPCAASGPPAEGRTYRDHFVPPSCWLTRRAAARRWGAWPDPATLARPVDHEYLRRAAIAGATFAFSPRLSVLKFPSAAFRPYAGSSPESSPARYLAAMTRDPREVEHDVLADLAIAFARHPQEVLTRVRREHDWTRHAFRTWIRRRLLDPVRDLPPFRAWLVRRFQAARQRARGRRGL